MSLEIEQDFACPYCWRTNTILVDVSAGPSQEFVVDCENCCSPILIRAQVNNAGITGFSAERENG